MTDELRASGIPVASFQIDMACWPLEWKIKDTAWTLSLMHENVREGYEVETCKEIIALLSAELKSLIKQRGTA